MRRPWPVRLPVAGAAALAADDAGVLYVTDEEAGRVYRIEPNGRWRMLLARHRLLP